MIRLLRAAQRYESTQSGILTRHCFAAGAHYDPSNVSFGALVGVDEHTLEPGAGFDWHAHAGVEIVSWVLQGQLLHRDGTGAVQILGPGELLRQSAATGLRHAESNAGDNRLRFVQTTWLSDRRGSLHVVRDRERTAGPTHLFVAQGGFTVGDHELDQHTLIEGDSLRTDEKSIIIGSGVLLVWVA